MKHYNFYIFRYPRVYPFKKYGVWARLFFVFWPFRGTVHIIHGLLMYCNQFISVTYKNQERMLQERSLRRIQYVPENDFPLKTRNEIAIITVSQPFMISMPVGVGNLVLGNPYRSALAAQQLSIDEGTVVPLNSWNF